MKIIKNIRLYDFKQLIEDGFIAFDEKIKRVGSMEDLPAYIETCHAIDDIEEIDGKGHLVMPGLVLGHGHIYSTFARGWLTPFNPHSFQDILDQLWWKLDGALGEEEVYYSGFTSGYEYLKQGITTVIDHHASGQIIKGSLHTLKKAVVDDIGLRGLFCFETSDRFDVDACIEENLSFYEEMKELESKDARGLLGLHASFSLSDESLMKLSKTPYDFPLHVHVAESIEDVNWTKNHCGLSILQRFDRYNLLREDSLYVHGVHLSDIDFKLIKESNGIMAFNPSSNMNNGVGLPQVNRAKAFEIPNIIGNDGLGFSLGRDLQNMIFSANLKGGNHFNLMDLRESILKSYEYASGQFGCKLGSLEEGFEADFMLIPYDTITPMTDENAFGHFVYGILENLHPKEVWVKGIHRINHYEMKKDIGVELVAGKKCAKALWEKLK